MQADKEIIIHDLEIINTWNTKFPDPESPHWKPVRPPFIHKTGIPFHPNIRVYWLRGKFNIDSTIINLKHLYYGINMGIIFPYSISLIKINDTIVNTAGLDSDNWFVRPVSYLLPEKINYKDTNEIYIRFTTDREIVTHTSAIFIQDKQTYIRSQKWNNLLFNQLPIGYCIFIIGLIITLLYKFYNYKVNRYLFYPLYLMSIIHIPLMVYSPVDLSFSVFIEPIIFSIASFQPLLVILIFQSIYGIYYTKQNIVASIVVTLHVVYIFCSIYFTFSINNLKYMFIIYLLYYVFLALSLNLHKLDKFKFKIILLILLFRIIFDLAYFIGFSLNIWYHYYSHIYATAIFILLILTYEVIENKKKRIELKKLYDKLEKDENQALTDTTEKKIEKIIDYITENFTSQISREGLASAVDMSPNYMSKAFSLHTGKKINDYINRLRIEAAAEKLLEPGNEKSIIDVALTAGFESLSTFNRAFKDVFNITPTEYKKKNKQ